MAAEHPVVACWHGPDSVGALQLAAALATTLAQPLALAVAYTYEPVALSARPVPTAVDERRAAAAGEAVARAHEFVADGIDVRDHVVAAEDVATGLADLARRLDATVLVLGRDIDGHVVRDVIAQAPCPVAVSPFDVAVPGPYPLAALAVADDGSPGAALAGHAVERLARHAGAAPAATVTTAPGRNAGAELVAASEGYDLLACGSRGRGRLAAAVLGSVSGELVRAAHCPVLVVPPSVAAAPGAPLGLTTAASAD
jgi:nucleotide-binding universal stress UspA family protein